MSELRLNAYRIMWLFVFFDLPTHTKTERRHAAQFRKALEKDGFAMMQYSVYVRHCVSKENMEVHIRRVRKSMPPSGMTSILSVTDKQYGEILNFWGKVERAGPEIPQQLEFFDIFVLQNGKTASNRLPQFAEHRFFRGTYGCNTLIINKCSA